MLNVLSLPFSDQTKTPSRSVLSGRDFLFPACKVLRKPYGATTFLFADEKKK